MKKAFESKDPAKIKLWLENAPEISVKYPYCFNSLQRDDHDFTAVMWSAKLGLLETVSILLQQGVDLHAQNAVGDTALRTFKLTN